MTSAQHTPGPWTFHLEPDGEIHISGDDLHVCRLPQGYPNEAANARLIASAPDLLDALEYAYTQLDPRSEHAHQASIALAKAKGP